MTTGDLLLGLLLSFGFFVSAFVSRIFKGRLAGVIIGGVAGLAVSVFVLVYGLTDVFTVGPETPAN